MADLIQQLASELSLTSQQVSAAVRLLDEGATVPFIARYRKEATQGLDDVQLRQLHSRLGYLRDLFERREKVLASLREQGRLTDDLAERIQQAASKAALEEIYAPYRPKRTSKSFKATEAGLGEPASRLLSTDIDLSEALTGFEHADYPDRDSQLAGIQAIIIDEWAKNIALTAELKQQFAKTAQLHSQLISEEKREPGKKFRDYFDWKEPLAKVPSHRLLAMLRGRQDNVLTLKVTGEDEPALARIRQEFALDALQPAERQQFLQQTAQLLWQTKLRPQIENSLLTEKRLAAEAQATQVFADNLRHLLLSAPAGARVTLGVDPGIRTGVKLAVVNASGDVVAHATVYPFAPQNDRAGAIAELARLCQEHAVSLIAIGNGTASRETDALIAEMLEQHPELDPARVTVSEAGASVYSASELASAELPELDVSIRGAVSIARRLQDPLAELVKIEPKAIGVGQYQHDVNQTQLAQTLDAVVEDCVNAVGVDVNTASPAILGHIAGLNSAIAQQIVEYRKTHGPFTRREQLRQVPRLGERTFEQAAGFLRIQQGDEPLDASSIHPEQYPLVRRMAEQYATPVEQLLANSEIIRQIDPQQFVSDQVGELTIRDILTELEKPARDPRPAFRTVQFRDDVKQISDLSHGMQLEGVVTNVTNFGAFVDIGVHQDGLVHISELADQFVSDPQQLVKPGQIVQVRVLQVDQERNRINLSMKSEKTEKTDKSDRPERTEKRGHTETTAERPPRQPRDGAQRERREPPRNTRRDDRPQRSPSAKPASDQPSAPAKIGGLGELLLQAGIKGSR